MEVRVHGWKTCTESERECILSFSMGKEGVRFLFQVRSGQISVTSRTKDSAFIAAPPPQAHLLMSTRMNIMIKFIVFILIKLDAVLRGRLLILQGQKRIVLVRPAVVCRQHRGIGDRGGGVAGEGRSAITVP